MTNKSYKEEKDEYYNKFLDIYYIDKWKNNFYSHPDNSENRPAPAIEFIIHRECNLECKYCYYNNFGDSLFPKEIENIDLSIKNTEKFLFFLMKNEMVPGSIEIFSGEAISASNYKKLFDVIYRYIEWLPDRLKDPSGEGLYEIEIPLNLIFINNKDYYELLVEEQKRFYEAGAIIGYSISTDGKYCDPISRPAKNKSFKYDDSFYDNIKKFTKDLLFQPGWHPMIAAENIHVWKENLDWFLDYLTELNDGNKLLALDSLYFLEVRNDNWTKKNLKDYESFLDYLADKIYNFVCEKDKDLFRKVILTGDIVNQASAISSYVSRGLTCSLQSALALRSVDLTICPCHRLSYKQFIAGSFMTDSFGEITGKVSSSSPEAHIASISTNYRNHVDCIDCKINTICSGPCLGANFESTGDMFISAPTMCEMEKTKTKKIIEIYKRYDMLNDIIDNLEQYSISNTDYSKYMRRKIIQIKSLSIKGDKYAR